MNKLEEFITKNCTTPEDLDNMQHAVSLIDWNSSPRSEEFTKKFYKVQLDTYKDYAANDEVFKRALVHRLERDKKVLSLEADIVDLYKEIMEEPQ